jgi:hypothetical protein
MEGMFISQFILIVSEMVPNSYVLSALKDSDENTFSLAKTHVTIILNNYLEDTASHLLLTNTFSRKKI